MDKNYALAVIYNNGGGYLCYLGTCHTKLTALRTSTRQLQGKKSISYPAFLRPTESAPLGSHH